MNLKIPLFVAIEIILLLALYFSSPNNLDRWLIICIGLGWIFSFSNSLDYYNKSYFLIVAILFISWGFLFYLVPLDATAMYLGWGMYGFLLFKFLYEYKKRENNPRMPYRNEW